MATPRASRRLSPGDETRATPAVGPTSGRTQFDLSSGAATAVVFVSIVLCFILLCTYCRCARQRAVAGARRRVMRDLIPGAAALLLRPAGAVLPPEVSYAGARASAAAKKGLPEDCPVCLEPFADDDGVRVVPACGHLYHTPCIDRWLDERNTCPVCRCAVVCFYAADGVLRDATVAVGGDDIADDQEAVLERVVAMIEAIRDEQRGEEAARRVPASAGGDGGG